MRVFFNYRTSPPATQTDPSLADNPEYLSQLLKDKRQLSAVPNMFMHIERLLDQGKKRNFENKSILKLILFI